jgi:Icc-related predicted phosphoesterase
MRLAFCSDLHLNFLSRDFIVNFAKTLNLSNSDAIVITGDIAEGDSLQTTLEILALYINKPIYYIHGNHDFYNCYIQQVRDVSQELTEKHDELFWLQCKGPIKLTDDVCLIGNDGFYDGRLGRYTGGRYTFDLLDFSAIKDFSRFSRNELYYMFNRLADESALMIENSLEEGFKNYKHVILATHCPPIEELAKYKGNPTEEYALPFFCSKAIGDVIKKVAAKHLDKEITILCGHTHDAASHQEKNISGYCAKAHYSYPEIYTIFTIEDDKITKGW